MPDLTWSKEPPKAAWVVFRMLSKGQAGGYAVNLRDPDAGIVGVLPVYATYEQAKKDWPDDEPKPVKHRPCPLPEPKERE